MAITGSVSICFIFTLGLFLAGGDLLTSFVTAVFFATIFYLYFYDKQTSSNIFHPYSYFIIIFGLFFYGLPTVLIILNPTNIYVLLMPTHNLAIVTILVTASFIAYGVGYRLPIGLHIARAVPLLCFNNGVSRSWFIYSALVLYGAGWLARIVSWRFGFHHMNPNLDEIPVVVSSLLVPLSMFCTLSYIVLLWDRFIQAQEARTATLFNRYAIAMMLIGLEVMAGVIQGSRARMIFPVLFAAFVYNYTVRRLSLRHLLLGTLVLVLVLLPAATVYRTAYFDALGESGASVAGARASVERLSQTALMPQITEAINTAVGRMTSHLEGILVVYDKVPKEIEHAAGNTFFPSGLLNFIPRLIWADKPMIFPGREFSQIFWGRSIGEVYATNTEIGLVGESYYNFGWLGLVMPMMFGIIMKFFVVRTTDYSRLEIYWAPRLFFTVFAVNAIGVFHYYPTDIVRAAFFTFVFLAIINGGFPKVLSPGTALAAQQPS